MSAATAAGAPINKGLVTGSIMLATIMQVLDTTIANVALPSMQGSLGAAQDQVTWVLTAYLVASAIMTPVTGWLSDRMGLRELFIASVTGFVVASMLCGAATSLGQMVVFRTLQGICGAALVPLSQTVLLNINSREEHGRAMAIWGAGIMVGPIIGPTLGGWLTETFNWRFVFYVNLPVGLLALAGLVLFLPRSERRARSFDFFGFAMLSLAIGALQLMLDRGEQADWFAAVEIWIYLGLTVSGLWAFVIHITGREHAFIDPQIFRDANLVMALVMIFMVGMILLAGLALLPPMLQGVMGYPVVTTGMVLAPRGVGTMVSMSIVGRLVGKVDARLLILAGLGLTAFSLWQMTQFSILMDSRPLVVSGVVQGLGLGLVFVPLSTIAFATLDPKFRADAASLFSLVRNIGSSVGISIVSVQLTHNIVASRSDLVARLTDVSPALDQVGGLGLDPAAALAMLNAQVQAQAAFIAYIDDFKLMMFVTLAVIPLLALMRKPRQPVPAAVGE
jgi:MFS transporter, DHA2 family, multidrug resistance protein